MVKKCPVCLTHRLTNIWNSICKSCIENGKIKILITLANRIRKLEKTIEKIEKPKNTNKQLADHLVEETKSSGRCLACNQYWCTC